VCTDGTFATAISSASKIAPGRIDLSIRNPFFTTGEAELPKFVRGRTFVKPKPDSLKGRRGIIFLFGMKSTRV
jgi:hypothetical protein